MRLPRLDFTGARHHVMNRGARRAEVFPTEETRDIFLELLAVLPQRFDVAVHGYALMPNHYHLMLESKTGKLSKAMQFLSADFTRKVNDTMGWDGSLFRGRFRNRVVDTDAYWRHLLAYLHLNPARAQLPHLDDPRWTSHHAYTHPDQCPTWLITSELKALHGDRGDYVAIIEDGLAQKLSTPQGFDADKLWRQRNTGVAEGVLTFVPFMETADALAQVCAVTGVDLDTLTTLKRGRQQNRPAWLAIWWMCRRCAISHGAVARAFSSGPTSISRILRRMDTLRRSDPVLTAWIERLEAGEFVPAQRAPRRRRVGQEFVEDN